MKHVSLIVYDTQEGVTRIEYKNHVIQIIPHGSDELMHCVLNNIDGSPIYEVRCLLKAIKYIDRIKQ